MSETMKREGEAEIVPGGKRIKPTPVQDSQSFWGESPASPDNQNNEMAALTPEQWPDNIGQVVPAENSAEEPAKKPESVSVEKPAEIPSENPAATAIPKPPAVMDMARLRQMRKVLNEKYRLVDEVVYPLTKTGTKFISVGVKPLEGWEPVLKIYNPQLTMAAVFNREELEEFLCEFPKVLGCVRDVKEDVELLSLRKYKIFLCKRKVIMFESKTIDPYKPLYIKIETVKTLLDLGDHLLSLIDSRLIKQKTYPKFGAFIEEVIEGILERKMKQDDSSFYTIIKERFAGHPALYEIVLKLPATIEEEIATIMTEITTEW